MEIKLCIDSMYIYLSRSIQLQLRSRRVADHRQGHRSEGQPGGRTPRVGLLRARRGHSLYADPRRHLSQSLHHSLTQRRPHPLQDQPGEPSRLRGLHGGQEDVEGRRVDGWDAPTPWLARSLLFHAGLRASNPALRGARGSTQTRGRAPVDAEADAAPAAAAAAAGEERGRQGRGQGFRVFFFFSCGWWCWRWW